MFNRIPELYRSWMKTIVVTVILLPLLWLSIGKILAGSYFDSSIFKSFQVLNKPDALAYLAVIYAVQIPIFILFLEQMVKAGRVYKIVLPRIFLFKEIMVSLVVFGLLILVSPRSSYLYFPVAAATLVSFVAIFRAVSVTFQFKQYINKIEKHIVSSAAKSTHRLIEMRKSSNNVYSAVKESPFIYYDYHADNPKMKVYKVRSLRDGYFSNIDAERVNSFFRTKITNKSNQTKELATSTKKQVEIAHIDLDVYQGQRIRPDTVLAKIIAPKSADFEKLAKIIRASVQPKANTDSHVSFFDELLNEVELDFADTLSKKSLPRLKAALDKYFLVVDGLDSQVKKEEDSDYNFKSAKEELNRWANDDLRNRIYKSFELLYELGQQLITASSLELASEYISHVYSKLLNSTERINKTASIRYETVLLHLLGQFVYKNEWNNDLTKEQDAILDDLLFRLKEHTSTLPYMIERVTGEELSDQEKQPYLEFMKLRLDSLRSLALATSKNKRKKTFNAVINIILSLDNRHEEKLGEIFTKYLRCNIMLIYAYIHQGGGAEYIGKLESHITKWQSEEIVQIILMCNEKGYADKWRIDTFDHAADGVMRSVTNYDLVLKSVLVDLLLKKRSIHDNIDFYGELKSLQETTFFTDGTSSDDNNSIMKMITENASQDEVTKKKLKNLIQSFIDVRRKWEHDQLADSQLDKEEIVKFTKLVNKKYLENSITLKLLGNKDISFVKDPKAKGYLRVGINQIYDKAAFIDTWHIGYANDYSAEQLGENIAQTQDNNVVHSLLGQRKEAENLDTLIEHLTTSGDRWFVFGNEIGRWDIEYRLKGFASVDKNNNLRFKGVKVGYNSQHFGYIRELPQGLFFVNTNNTGSMKVKALSKDAPVEVSIESYSLNKRLKTEILKSPPKWLAEKGNKSKQEEFLDTKARMLVNYVYKYEAPDSPEVWFLPIKDY